MLPLIAGMPSVSLSDAANLRLQSISFFLALFLLSALLIRWGWNALRTDFPRLPRLSYPRALGLVGLWGLLFLLVLTMISGARELMTPGAWKKDGLTYTLTDPKPPLAASQAPAGPTEADRREKLLVLYGLLAGYAASHDGRFPPSADDPAVAPDYWKPPHPSGMRYLYVPGRTPRDAGKVLAAEPELFGEGRMVLFADGRVVRMASAELAPLLKPEGK